MFYMKKFLFGSVIGLTMMVGVQAQLTVNTGINATNLASLLTGFGVNITNVQINCNSNAYGEFSGVSEIPITHGLMMTTGYIDTALLGPNNQFNCGSDNTFGGDIDLTNDAGTNTYNACVIEFDCTPLGDTLEFNFGFGSEEYPEYVGTEFNDIFAIYFSDTSGVTYNAAQIPMTTTPVSINNVNHLTNPAYYIDNSAGQYIEFDGLTQNLHAFAVVVPGNTYHFKIAIADAGDPIYDSGVLLEAFSFRSMPMAANVEETLSQAFAIFPVPATDRLQIQSKSNLPLESVAITNALGQIMLTENIQSTSTTLDLSGFTHGLYMVTCYTTQGKFTQKIIVQ
jgi:hypothetical protein